jgi:hypothetical protein
MATRQPSAPRAAGHLRGDNKPGPSLFAEVFLEGPNPTCHCRARRRRKLHFNWDQFAAGFDNEIDFHSSRSAPEVDLRLFAAVDECFHNFEQDRGLEDRTSGPAAA